MASSYLSMYFSRSPHFVSREAVDERVIVPFDDQDVGQAYALNYVGGRIWDLLDGERPLEEIELIIAQEFDCEPEDIRQDLIDFIRSLQSINAVITP